MGTTAQWREVQRELQRELQASDDPWSSPRITELYRLAREDGLKHLTRKFGPRDEHQDDVQDALVKVLEKLVDPTTGNPRALFIQVLIRTAIDRHRKTKRERSTAPEEMPAAHEAAPRPPGQLLDRCAALERAAPRDRQVLVAIGLGEDRQKIADSMGLTRANVDQIVSRFRKQAKFEGS